MKNFEQIVIDSAKNAFLSEDGIKGGSGMGYCLKGLTQTEMDFVMLTYAQDTYGINRLINSLLYQVAEELGTTRMSVEPFLERALLTWLQPNAKPARERLSDIKNPTTRACYKILMRIDAQAKRKIEVNAEVAPDPRGQHSRSNAA